MTIDEPMDFPIDGTLDLHQFRPNETREALLAYIEECLKRGVTQIRVVHGKGIGVQREIVRSTLASHPNVVSYWHDGGTGGGWGATVVDLRLPTP
jgi:DNA-nicking Smr family endonuclease